MEPIKIHDRYIRVQEYQDFFHDNCFTLALNRSFVKVVIPQYTTEQLKLKLIQTGANSLFLHDRFGKNSITEKIVYSALLEELYG
jgi:hypothetical protein